MNSKDLVFLKDIHLQCGYVSVQTATRSIRNRTFPVTVFKHRSRWAATREDYAEFLRTKREADMVPAKVVKPPRKPFVPEAPPVVLVADVCQALGYLNITTANKSIREGKFPLPTIKFKGKWAIHESAYDDFVNNIKDGALRAAAEKLSEMQAATVKAEQKLRMARARASQFKAFYEKKIVAKEKQQRALNTLDKKLATQAAKQSHRPGH